MISYLGETALLRAAGPERPHACSSERKGPAASRREQRTSTLRSGFRGTRTRRIWRMSICGVREVPAIYDLYLSTLDRPGQEYACIHIPVGSGKQRLLVRFFTVNGSPSNCWGQPSRLAILTVRGGDGFRHGTDLLLMKRHNINCIRTSHYPNDRFFWNYAICWDFMS